MPDLDIITMAVKVPTTLAHTHIIYANLKKEATVDEVKELFRKTPRIILLKEEDGYTSTAEIIERFRDLGRPRYDMPEVAIWEESIAIQEKRLFWMHAVHSESIIIPENVDCIRAMTGLEKDKWNSIKKTNESMEIE